MIFMSFCACKENVKKKKKNYLNVLVGGTTIFWCFVAVHVPML